jgi:type IV pilus assembly protein PilA
MVERTVAAPDSGFTLVELMMVVLVIGILVAVSVPVFTAAEASASRKTCWSNQRMVEGAAQTYLASKGSLPAGGPVDGSHPLITQGYLRTPPYCPGSTLGTNGTYGMDASGTVDVFPTGCSHAHY